MDESTKLLIDNANSDINNYLDGSLFPLKPQKTVSRHKSPNNHSINMVANENANLTFTTEKQEGTEGTKGTATNDGAFIGSPIKKPEGTEGTMHFDSAIDPIHEAGDPEQLEALSFAELNAPCYLVKDDWFLLDGVKRKPGVHWCYETEGNEKKEAEKVVKWICTPLHIDGLSNTEDGRYFGRLLRFKDTLGRWRKWAMPMELLKGSFEELRGELLAAGMLYDLRNKSGVAEYIAYKTPKNVITAATRTGWSNDGKSFVFHDSIVGDQAIFFQSESLNNDGVAKTGGNYKDWQKIAKLCEGNHVLIVSLCVSFAGALLAKTHQDSGGIHWLGDSSIGKSTALMVGCSVWGDDKFKRTWRATSNGLEGIAALLSDTCLCLDEINEADPREVGAIVYSLGNGTGKTRASRTGSARGVHRWRLSLLSTGERSINALMQEGGKQAKSGQLVRLLNIPAVRRLGVFDELHHFQDGRSFADHFKTQTAKHYGHAGVQFIEFLIDKGAYDYGQHIADYEPHFGHKDSQAARVASRFALYALAGELAIEAGIVPWDRGAALSACVAMFNRWLSFRGNDSTEHTQILKAVSDYLVKYGDSRFTNKDIPTEPLHGVRSGWFTYTGSGEDKETTYLLTSEALKDACSGFDLKRALDALDSAGWIVEKDEGRHSKKTNITGGGKPRLYWIKPIDTENETVPPVPSPKNEREPLEAAPDKAVPSVPPVPSEKTAAKVKSKDAEAF